jgi:hypothetical protein
MYRATEIRSQPYFSACRHAAERWVEWRGQGFQHDVCVLNASSNLIVKTSATQANRIHSFGGTCWGGGGEVVGSCLGQALRELVELCEQSSHGARAVPADVPHIRIQVPTREAARHK